MEDIKYKGRRELKDEVMDQRSNSHKKIKRKINKGEERRVITNQDWLQKKKKMIARHSKLKDWSLSLLPNLMDISVKRDVF